MRNFELRMLAYLVSESPEKYKDGGDGLTLVVNGMLMSGNIIPKPAYLEQKQNTTLKHLFDTADKLKAEIEVEEVQVEEEVGLEDYTRLYLKNAKYFIGGQFYPSNGDNYAAINIDSIDAFNMGALGPEPEH
ncbi:hypothetical protein PY247_10705 [Acinetobacter proteolyticus]|nr:hypothetical protein [Acinetobacter proteolyticus]WEI20143.1 hypothetical protein PY247_10705 [Acinetobacter proteolyticus]